MSSLYRKRIVALLTCLLVCLAGSGTTRAQGGDIVGGAATSRKDLGGGASSSVVGGGGRVSSGGGGGGGGSTRRAKPRNTVTVASAAPRTRTITTPTTGTLSVVTEPGATIYLEPAAGGTALEGKVSADRIFIFDKLKPGNYVVSADMNGTTYAEKPVTIVKNTPASVTLEVPTYRVAFTTNLTEGSLRYAPAVVNGNEFVVTGKTIYEKLRGGRVELTGLKPGLYVADIIPDDPGYKEERTSFKVEGDSAHTITLDRLETTRHFAASWSSLNAWQAPQGWRTDSFKLIVNGPGVALPADSTYRFYKDFEIRSNIRMVNGVAASFVARAENANNYYLIQLTGANADEPYVLRGFVIKGGKVVQQLGSAPINSFASTLQTGKFFAVKMRMQDNNIRVWITDSQTGESLTLGILTDPYRTFAIGAVGLAARDREQNEVADFSVCYKQCP